MKTTCWLALLVFTGCSTLDITSSWKSPNINRYNYEKIMVLGLIHEKNLHIQQKMENHLVEDLADIGYKAISALQEYGPHTFSDMTEKTAIEKIKDSGVDAVITIVLLDKKREKRYVPSSIYYSPYGYYYNNFWWYRSALYHRIYQPGYYVTDTKYFWESNFYDMSSQSLIYSVHTTSFSPSNTESMGHEYGLLIVKNLVKEEILQSKNK